MVILSKSSIILALFILLFVMLSGTSLAESKTFSDVDTKHWAKETIQWGVEKGVVTGYTDGTFKPNQNVSESEFLAMLIRAYKPEIKVKSDGHWAENYYVFAAKNNYPLVGFDDVEKRNAIINRKQVAELVSATQGVNYIGDDAIRYLLGNDLAKGTDPNKKTIKNYNPDGKLSRAEAVQFIKNLLEHGKEDLAARPTQPSDPSILPDIPQGNKMYGNVEYIGKGKDRYDPSPMDKIARDASIEFIKSIKVEGTTLSFTIPQIPKGYIFSFSYNDKTKPEGTVPRYDYYVGETKATSGKKYSFKFYGNDGYLVFGFTKEKNFGVVVESATIDVPSLKMVSSFEGWE